MQNTLKKSVCTPRGTPIKGVHSLLHVRVGLALLQWCFPAFHLQSFGIELSVVVLPGLVPGVISPPWHLSLILFTQGIIPLNWEKSALVGLNFKF